MSFEYMNNGIIEGVEIIKNDDVREKKIELKDTAIREYYSINGKFCRGYSTHAQNRNIPELVIKTHNIWINLERTKVKHLN